MLRVGVLTSGGDCQGLNAALRGVAKTLFEKVPDVEIFGYVDGYKGLMLGNYKVLWPEDFSGILTLGGTILGTSRMPFKELSLPADPTSNLQESRLEAYVRNYKMQKLDYLVVLGGNGTQRTAHAMAEAGCKVIGVPKTIDNDLWGTEMTFGFHSAVGLATKVIDGVHTTATSHGKIFIVELMGDKAGWLTLHAGIAGGADIILLPEIPYNFDKVCEALVKRQSLHKPFSIIAMASGAQEQQLESKRSRQLIMPSRAYKLAEQLAERLQQEVSVTIPGHYLRGGSPSAYDRVFAGSCGSYAAKLLLEGSSSCMVALQNNKLGSVPLAEVAAHYKAIPENEPLLEVARDLGICFGD